MHLGFYLHPEEMSDNSPTFQRWVREFRVAQVPKAQPKTTRFINRPFGTYIPWALVPNVETLVITQISFMLV
jgi:hypothetical protein